jgi:hypothetical protein
MRRYAAGHHGANDVADLTAETWRPRLQPWLDLPGILADRQIERWNICVRAASIRRGAERGPEQTRLAPTFWLMGRGHRVEQPMLPVVP